MKVWNQVPGVRIVWDHDLASTCLIGKYLMVTQSVMQRPYECQPFVWIQKNNTRRRNLDNNGVFWYKMTITQKANFWKKELILLLVSKKKVKFKKDLYLKVPNSIYHCPPLKTIILYDQMKKKKLMNNFYEFVKQAKK